MNRSVISKWVLSAITLTLFLGLVAGCSSEKPAADDKMEEAASEIEELERENQDLRARLGESGTSTAETAAGSTAAGTSLTGEPGAAPVSSPSTIGATSGAGSPAQTLEPTAPPSVVLKSSYMDISDVPSKQLIEALYMLKVFPQGQRKFNPYGKLTRAEFAKLLFKASDTIQEEQNALRLAPQLKQQFSDVPPAHPAYKYVQALAATGYQLDDGSEKFRPDDPITREEMIGIKAQVDEGESIKPDPVAMAEVWNFKDIAKIDKFYSGSIYTDHFIKGPQGNNINRAFGKVSLFRPRTPVMRSEAAASLWQVGTSNALDKLQANINKQWYLDHPAERPVPGKSPSTNTSSALPADGQPPASR